MVPRAIRDVSRYSAASGIATEPKRRWIEIAVLVLTFISLFTPLTLICVGFVERIEQGDEVLLREPAWMTMAVCLSSAMLMLCGLCFRRLRVTWVPFILLGFFFCACALVVHQFHYSVITNEAFVVVTLPVVGQNVEVQLAEVSSVEVVPATILGKYTKNIRFTLKSGEVKTYNVGILIGESLPELARRLRAKGIKPKGFG